MELLYDVFFGNPLYKYFDCIIYVILGVVVAKLIKLLLEYHLKRKYARGKRGIDAIFIESLSTPIVIFLFTSAIRYAALSLVLEPHFRILLDDAIDISYITAMLIFSLSFIDKIFLEYIVPRIETSDNRLHGHILPPVRKLLKIIVILGAIILALENMGFNIATVVAGLGIGGLAVALASKPTLENFIAGILIYTDNTFITHDWIKWGNGQGLVEEIGLRSTKVRSFDDSLLIIPNTDIISSEIENKSARRKRRTITTLGLTYDTTKEEIIKATDIVKKILNDEDGVVHPIRVNFTNYGAYSLDIRVEYYVNNLSYEYYLNTCENVNLKIRERFEKENLKFAFPSQTLYLSKEEDENTSESNEKDKK
ncbi:mechanosensitive ion channel family protein [Methanococcus voltae]|uniref:MscS Mechanosensitive ion channel n=1 Tax=Methanococcus voltae (strain ATCC BAA-1334 / A3) TaxID=456320 RepID=D7DR82_METV3|nr:mechanosensitive ion channel family protein [Methanococcus voltae]MCS3901019.1 MscS family membrane protein [Methanococcus voltae]